MDPFLYLSPNGKGLQTCKTKSSLLVLVYFQFTCLLIKGESGECYIDISCGTRSRAQSVLSSVAAQKRRCENDKEKHLEGTHQYAQTRLILRADTAGFCRRIPTSSIKYLSTTCS
jgi:hypothetical protein